jgi:hypothetical protein
MIIKKYPGKFYRDIFLCKTTAKKQHFILLDKIIIFG